MQHPIATPTSTAELASAVEREVARLIGLANKHCATPSPIPTVSFRASGRRAGAAYLHQGRLNFNRHLLIAYPDAYLNEVVPHEVAHWVVHCNYGKVKPHGREWQAVMGEVFGCEPKTTHTLDTSVVPMKQWLYQCHCQTHTLTTRRHNAIRNKTKRYYCRECGGELKAVVG